MFEKAPIDVLGDEGERVGLGCSVSSNPKPTYTWVKNDLSNEVRFKKSKCNTPFYVEKDIFNLGVALLLKIIKVLFLDFNIKVIIL